MHSSSETFAFSFRQDLQSVFKEYEYPGLGFVNLENLHSGSREPRDELAEVEEASPSRHKGAPLSRWEDLKEGEAQVDNTAYTLSGRPKKGR